MKAQTARGKLDNVDLDHLRARVAVSEHTWEEYLRFLALKASDQDWDAATLSPPEEVDAVWHAHILDTKSYAETCERLGHFIHHDPDGGLDKKARTLRRSRALRLYEQAWGAAPAMWKEQEVGGRRAAPDEASDLVFLGCDESSLDTVAVKVFNGETREESHFRVHTTTRLSALMNFYTQKHGACPEAARFGFDGNRLRPDDTPESLEMVDDDVIDYWQACVAC